MVCPGGCIGGGGQPRMTDDSVRLKRISAIYAEDEGATQIARNEAIQQLYKEFLGAPLGEMSHHLLHTHYHERADAGSQCRRRFRGHAPALFISSSKHDDCR